MHRGSNRNTWKSRSYGKISLAKRTQKQKYTKLPLGKPQKFDTTKKKHHVLTLVSCFTIPKRKKNLQLTAHWNLGAYQFPAYSAPPDHVLVMFHWATYLLSCWWQCHQALLTSSSLRFGVFRGMTVVHVPFGTGGRKGSSPKKIGAKMGFFGHCWGKLKSMFGDISMPCEYRISDTACFLKW